MAGLAEFKSLGSIAKASRVLALSFALGIGGSCLAIAASIVDLAGQGDPVSWLYLASNIALLGFTILGFYGVQVSSEEFTGCFMSKQLPAPIDPGPVVTATDIEAAQQERNIQTRMLQSRNPTPAARIKVGYDYILLNIPTNSIARWISVPAVDAAQKQCCFVKLKSDGLLDSSGDPVQYQLLRDLRGFPNEDVRFHMYEANTTHHTLNYTCDASVAFVSTECLGVLCLSKKPRV
jgi:hypothetical protein